MFYFDSFRPQLTDGACSRLKQRPPGLNIFLGTLNYSLEKLWSFVVFLNIQLTAAIL